MVAAAHMGVHDLGTVFSVSFAILGLSMLFGQKVVTFGSVLLLGSVSAAVASAWVGVIGSETATIWTGTFFNSSATLRVPFVHDFLQMFA